jgi:rare lipoprotein A
MRSRAERMGGGQGARVGALLIGTLALAGCAATERVSSGPRYSPKMVADGEPVPKGGGRYSLGKTYAINGVTYIPAEDPRYRADGVASWYGPDFHGRQTANGEIYDMHSVSAAHPTLPLPSYARVTNLDNGRSIVVRVNDRGPFTRNRVIDLSIGAAKALDFHNRGLANVRVEYIGRAPIEGSDDRMLMATLRQGSPAPAPSRIMVAAAGPFLPGAGGPDTSTPSSAGRLPPQRPFRLGTGAPPPTAARATIPDRTVETASARTAQARSVVRLPDVPEGKVPRGSGSPAAYGPAPADGALGLMSGRGLY